jgi:hypothetical protein
MIDASSNGAWPLHGYSVVDGGDIVGITQRGGEMVRIPAWTVIGDHLILGAHPADTMPPNVDVIANVDSFRFGPKEAIELMRDLRSPYVL